MSSILFVLNGPAGGAALSARELMRGLTDRGHRSFVVCPPSPDHSALEALSATAEAVELMPIPWWNKKWRSTWYKRPAHFALSMARSRFHTRTVRSLVKLIDRWNIDIVHTNTAVTVDGALAARLRGRAHVWHIREQIGRDGLFRFWLPEPLLARTFATLSDALIANSAESKRLFDRHGLGSQVEVVYNGVDVEAFVSPAASLRERFGADGPAQVLVGMVANLTSRMKRHDVFIRAAAQVKRARPDARFVVVGIDPETESGFATERAYAARHKALAKELGLNGELVWAGFQPDIPAVMNALDVLVHPSDQESFGRVAVEAMAAGKPAVVPASGGLAEIVEDGETGFKVTPNDPAAFAASIDRLVADRSLRIRLGTAGRDRARDRFSIQRTVDQVDRIYQRINR